MEVRIATVSDLREGRVIESRLRAEGVPCRLQSEALGPFVVTVGSMGTVEIFVPEELADLATQILESSETTDITPGDRTDSRPR